MNGKTSLAIVIMMMSLTLTLGITVNPIVLPEQQADAYKIGLGEAAKAPTAITGDNVYVAWWTNKSGNDEVIFRASTDKGQTFGDNKLEQHN